MQRSDAEGGSPEGRPGARPRSEARGPGPAPDRVPRPRGPRRLPGGPARAAHDRFAAFWKRQEETGTWKRLERAVDGYLRRAREARRTAKAAERARRQAEAAARAARRPRRRPSRPGSTASVPPQEAEQHAERHRADPAPHQPGAEAPDLAAAGGLRKLTGRSGRRTTRPAARRCASRQPGARAAWPSAGSSQSVASRGRVESSSPRPAGHLVGRVGDDQRPGADPERDAVEWGLGVDPAPALERARRVHQSNHSPRGR